MAAVIALRDSQPALPEITAEDRSFLYYSPNTDAIVEWVCRYASAAVNADRAARAPAAQRDALDAARYRMLRRGQHLSVINGVVDTLRAEELDAAIDAARYKAKEGQSHD